jgi:hypothetical protein
MWVIISFFKIQLKEGKCDRSKMAPKFKIVDVDSENIKLLHEASKEDFSKSETKFKLDDLLQQH